MPDIIKLPETLTSPVTDSVEPSKVIFDSTVAFGTDPFKVITPLFVVPVRLNNPEDPDVPLDPDEPDEPLEPEVPEDPLDPDVPEDPLEPEVPEVPEDPLDPLDPEDPEDPLDPDVPEDPLEPDVPEDPLDPDVPLIPDETVNNQFAPSLSKVIA